MTHQEYPSGTVSEILDAIGRHPEGAIPDIPQEIIEIFAEEYDAPSRPPETKLGRQALDLAQHDARKDAA